MTPAIADLSLALAMLEHDTVTAGLLCFVIVCF